MTPVLLVLFPVAFLYAAASTVDRSLDSLDASVRENVRLALADCAASGNPMTVTETRRSQLRQNFLFYFGGGVTWTVKSNHTTGEAVDVWPKKAKSDAEARSLLMAAFPLWNRYGLSSLAQKHPGTADYGHFERTS